MASNTPSRRPPMPSMPPGSVTPSPASPGPAHSTAALPGSDDLETDSSSHHQPWRDVIDRRLGRSRSPVDPHTCYEDGKGDICIMLATPARAIVSPKRSSAVSLQPVTNHAEWPS